MAAASKNFSGSMLEAVRAELQGTLGMLGSTKLRAQAVGIKPLEEVGKSVNGPVTSLGRIGGALNSIGGGGSSDPQVSELKQLNRTMKQVLDKLGGGQSGPPQRQVVHGT